MPGKRTKEIGIRMALRAVSSAPGVGRTRHSRIGAAEQPSVAVRQPSKNQRLAKSPTLQSAGTALSVDLLNIKQRQKPKQLKKIFRVVLGLSAPSLCFVTFSPARATPTNDLRPTGTGAIFVLCNIFTVEAGSSEAPSSDSCRESNSNILGLTVQFEPMTRLRRAADWVRT